MPARGGKGKRVLPKIGRVRCCAASLFVAFRDSEDTWVDCYPYFLSDNSVLIVTDKVSFRLEIAGITNYNDNRVDLVDAKAQPKAHGHISASADAADFWLGFGMFGSQAAKWRQPTPEERALFEKTKTARAPRAAP